jgi:hypothetical protein
MPATIGHARAVRRLAARHDDRMRLPRGVLGEPVDIVKGADEQAAITDSPITLMMDVWLRTRLSPSP